MKVKVKIVKIRSRYLVMRWTCPETGKQLQRAAKTNDQRKAERMAAILEDELSKGTYFKPNNISWIEFREMFQDLRMPNFKAGTGLSYDTTFNRFELLMKPSRLSQINTLFVARFQSRLRELKTADATIAKHLRQLKAALNWAKSMSLIQRVPDFSIPKAGRHQRVMKGRPITDDEFQKMLNSVELVVGSESAESWKQLLHGLMLSGLRLGEALALTWHRSNEIFVDFDSGKFPAFRISAFKDKGGTERILPMTPDFAQFLEQIGSKESGYVFNLGRVKTGRKTSFVRTTDWVSKIGSRIGVAANVEISGSDQKKKFASFHDLRRSFGVRWSKKVLPQVLKQLMRHSSIDTTLRYYVGEDADRVSEELWSMVTK